MLPSAMTVKGCCMSFAALAKAIFTVLLFSLFTMSRASSMDVVHLDSLLDNINVPVLRFTTDSGNEPQGYPIYPPEGLWGVGLAGDNYEKGKLVVTQNGKQVYSSGPYTSSTSGARIKLRGNTSAVGYKQKPYKITLSAKHNLVEAEEKSKDWVLLPAHYGNVIKIVTGNLLGKIMNMVYVPGYDFVNLVINGDYKGFYILTEGVEKETGRCNIDDSGFIIEDDAYWWNTSTYFKGEILPDPVGYTFKYPDADDLTPGRLSQIKQYILDVETLLVEHGDIGAMIDIDSFARWLLAQDILGMGDAGGTNRYLIKENFTPNNPNSTLLKMGILWDFDAAFTNQDQFSAIHRLEYGFYFTHLWQFSAFREAYLKAWEDIAPHLYETLMTGLEEMNHKQGESIDACKKLHAMVHPSKNESFASEIDFVDQWLQERIKWLDVNIPQEVGIKVEQLPNAPQEIYNIQGIKVQQATAPGVYIINGRKVLVR